jgi:hypothetical protein
MHEHSVNNVYSPTFKIFTEKFRSFFNATFPKKSSPMMGRSPDRQLHAAPLTPDRQLLKGKE